MQTTEQAIEETVLGIYVVRAEGADIGVVVEGTIVLENFSNVPFAAAMLFRQIYALNLTYPSELRQTPLKYSKSCLNLMQIRYLRKH